VTLGGGAIVGGTDGLAGFPDGDAGGAIGVALHAAKAATATREAAKTSLDIVNSKVLAVDLFPPSPRDA
jgi:hypothetical protein